MNIRGPMDTNRLLLVIVAALLAVNFIVWLVRS